MKKNVLLVFCLLFSLAGFSQKQISNFENETRQSPNNYQYLLTFKDKVFFSAFTPETGNELWVSDGTESGTKILKDINEGELSSSLSNFAKSEDWLYFLNGDKLWKTDGTAENTFEIQSLENQIIIRLATIDDKVLIVSYYKYNTGPSGNQFNWIQSDDTFDEWERQVLNFNIEDNSIFYVKQKKSEYILYHYLGVKKEVFTSKNDYGGLSQFKNDSIVYCTFENQSYGSPSQRYLLSINTQYSTITQYNWGNHNNNIPLYAKDENGIFYLLKANSFTDKKDSLHLYRPSTEGIGLTNKAGGENIFIQYYGSGTRFHSNILFRNNQIFFLEGHGMYSTTISYFHYYDLKKETLTQWKYLHADYPGQVVIKDESDSTFKVTTPIYTFNYNPETRHVSNRKLKRFGFETTSFRLNYKSFELSDNLYQINEKSKVAFLKNRPITTYYSYQLSMKDDIGRKKIFQLYRNNSKALELWTLDTLGLSKIETFKGENYAGPFRVPGYSNKYFYGIKDSLKYDVFQTDYSPKGASLVYSLPIAANDYVPNVFYNKSKILIVHKNTVVLISKEKIVKREIDNNYAYSTPNDFYFGKPCGDSFCYYKLLDDGSLKPEPTLARSELISKFENKDYYRFKDEIFYFNDVGERVSLIKQVASQEQIGNFLICRTTENYISENSIFKTIDLRSKKVVSSIKAIWGKFSYEIDGESVLYLKKADDKTNAVVFNFDGKETQEISLGNSNIRNIQKFKNGFFIYYISENGTQTKIEYYDLNQKRFYIVAENYNNLYIEVSPNFEFILIHKASVTTSSVNQIEYFTWSIKSKVFKKVAIFKDEVFNQLFKESHYISSRKEGDYQKQQFWSFENDSLIRKEPNPKNLKDVNLADIKATTVKFTEKRGSEAFAIGNDFSINFEEIVKGPEGIILNNTFIFENQFYIIASTYSHGLQIWQMTDNEKIEPLKTEEDLSIKVYPNPVQDFLTIETPTMLHYSIYNSIGQEVRQGSIENKQQINIENLPQGLYIMLFNDGKKTTSKKIVKL